jgi:hypothetical protein
MGDVDSVMQTVKTYPNADEAACLRIINSVWILSLENLIEKASSSANEWSCQSKHTTA